MRITIIPSDGLVMIDGVGYDKLDLSDIDPSIHAVQWYDGSGEVEIKNPTTGKMIENREIESLDEFQSAVDAWIARDVEIKITMEKKKAIHTAQE